MHLGGSGETRENKVLRVYESTRKKIIQKYMPKRHMWGVFHTQRCVVAKEADDGVFSQDEFDRAKANLEQESQQRQKVDGGGV